MIARKACVLIFFKNTLFHMMIILYCWHLLWQVKQDMNAPLAHYFLYTGHNSYLTGNQISSDSSTQPIISALKNSVRVIELDLWPNSRSDDAEVRHGGYLYLYMQITLLTFILIDYPILNIKSSYKLHLILKIRGSLCSLFLVHTNIHICVCIGL